MFIIKNKLLFSSLVWIFGTSKILADYSHYAASQLARPGNQLSSPQYIQPYYHSANDYENRNYEFWYENKPMPHYHGSVPIVIHQHYTQTEQFVDDDSYITDPPNFSLKKAKKTTQKLLKTIENSSYNENSITKTYNDPSNLRTSGPKINEDMKTNDYDKLTNLKTTGSQINANIFEITSHPKPPGKRINEDTKINDYDNPLNLNPPVSKTYTNSFDKVSHPKPPGTRINDDIKINTFNKPLNPTIPGSRTGDYLDDGYPDILLPKVDASKSFTGKEPSSHKTIVQKQLTKSEEKLLKEIEDEITMEDNKKGKSISIEDITLTKNVKENNVFGDENYKKNKKVTTDIIGTSVTSIKSLEKNTKYGNLAPGTQPNPMPNLPKVSTSGNTYNNKEKSDENKTIFGNEITNIEPDNDKNLGSDYMDDLDKMSTREGKTLAPFSSSNYGKSKENVGVDYDLISKPSNNKKSSNEHKESGDFFDENDNLFETKKYTGSNKDRKTNVEPSFIKERKTNVETSFPNDDKFGSNKKCCACCKKDILTSEISSPRNDFTQVVRNPSGPVPILTNTGPYGNNGLDINNRPFSNNVANIVTQPYIPTGAELAARYGVPYPSMVSQGGSCGSLAIPCIPIPYIPPPCCITPPPKCCLPTIPCCPKIEVSCCAQKAICCQPVPSQYQQQRTSCGACNSKTLTKYRTKRNTCLPCKNKNRSKRSDFLETLYSDVNHHERVKRFGCIPCLHRRAKRTPFNSNCQSCTGNGRSKRSINCSLCNNRSSPTILNRLKRESSMETYGYDNIFNCDKSCCDYSKCNEINAKPLKGQMKMKN
uniref:GATA-type domain-containing protein n=1 Tax=Parastrongyloides trichosuri TaxID=131310 RepID=A0A0N4ZSI7_PARTI